MIIYDVSIKGFWGRKEVKTNIFKDVTIFIGENGSGKTTFINIVTSALTVDLIQLNNLEFEEIIINLHDPNDGRRKKRLLFQNWNVQMALLQKYLSIKLVLKRIQSILTLELDLREKRELEQEYLYFQSIDDNL